MDNLDYNYEDYDNVTLNPNEPVDGYGPGRLPEDIVALIIFLVVFLLGVPGNSLVVWVTAFEARKTINAIWFLNLAMADLLSCLALPILFYSVLQDNTWPLGNNACRILPSLILLNLFASILLLAAISADRFLLVFNPIWCQKFRGSHLAWAACGVAWVLALLLTIPSFMYRQEHYDPYAKTFSCGVNYGQHGFRTERAVAIVRLIVGFVLPLLTLSICYTFLLLRTWSRKATRSTKTLKVVLAVVISFFVFWLPYQVTGTIMAVLPRSSPIFSRVQRLDSLCVSLAYINCCINPIIYAMAGKSFHGRLRRSLPSIIRNALTEDSVGRESKTFTRSTVDSAVSKSQAV